VCSSDLGGRGRTNARTPTTHAASHADGGSDEITVDASQIGSGTVATARLGTGTASATTFLAGDQTWKAAGSTNASDLTSGTLANARLDTEVRAAARITARSLFI
jgi:hypothetical protein